MKKHEYFPFFFSIVHKVGTDTWKMIQIDFRTVTNLHTYVF